MRGSGELFAWGDSYAYLRRRDRRLLLTLEHRAAESHDDIELELARFEHGPALCLKTDHDTPLPDPGGDPQSQIRQLLEAAAEPLSQRQIRQNVRARNATVSTTLEQLCQSGQVIRDHDGYRLNPDQAGLPLLEAVRTGATPGQPDQP